MVNTISLYMSMLSGLMRLIGMTPKIVEIETGTIVDIWVPKQSTKDKPVVVFLHGFGLNGNLTWQFQVMSLAKDYNIYVPNFLFFGNSVSTNPDRSPEFQAKCMVKALMKLGVEKCTLVGLSYGGMVGFKMAELYPNFVESVVITCSVLGLTESITRTSLERIGGGKFSCWADYLLPQTVEGSKNMLEIATDQLPWIPDFIHRHMLEVMFDHRKERIELLEALVVKDEEFKIPHFQQNIHLLCGEEDRIFNMAVALELKEQLKGKATLSTIKKAGHLVPLERPFAFNIHLKKILASLQEDMIQI